MPRYVIDVHYDGTRYAGWQTQPNAVTVQSEVDRALTMVLRTPTFCYGAGRTDAGVHALQMPAHFDYDGELHPHFMRAMNGVLPTDIALIRAYEAPNAEFHARFSAKWRSYRYQLIFRKHPHLFHRAFWVKEEIDVEAMQRGAKILLEYDSFESLCKAHGSNKTYLCKMMESYWEWEGDMLVYHVKADRFLRGMVRAIVGTLLLMGTGKLDEQGFRDILEAKDRKKAGGSVVADGLFLDGVGY